MFEWQEVTIAPGPNNDNQMRLVVRADYLPANTRIPILGGLTRTHPLSRRDTHAYKCTTLSPFTIDGHPSIAPHKGVGSRGLAIAMMANEPTHTSKATAIFLQDYLHTLRPLKKGDEITALYAPRGDTQMAQARERNKYTVLDDGEPTAIRKDTRAVAHTTLRYYAAKWYQYCTLDTGAWAPPATPAHPHTPGLPNLGQTCYINAAIQTLLQTHTAMINTNTHHHGNRAYTNLIRSLTRTPHTPPSTPSIESNIASILHHCNTNLGRTLFTNRQAEVGTMLTDLITLGPEPDNHEGNSVLHLTHITCNNTTCGSKHGAANFTSAIPLHVPATDTLATTLQECIAKSATTHNPTEYRCPSCGNSNTSQTEQYLPMGFFYPILLPRDTRRSSTSVLPQHLNFKYDPSSLPYDLVGIVRHHGKTYDAGHCTSLAKRGDSWYCFDDTSVTKTTWTDITTHHQTHLGGQEQIFLYARPFTHVSPQSNTNTSARTPTQAPAGHTSLGPSLPTPHLPKRTAWCTPPLLLSILNARLTTRHSAITEICRPDILPPTTSTIRGEYTHQAHRAMSTDKKRNSAYTQAILATQKEHSLCLDIGPGPQALLARQIIQTGRHCVAIEANTAYANEASRLLKDLFSDLSSWTVLCLEAEAIHVTHLTNHATSHPSHHTNTLRIFHETLGLFASSEGAPRILHALRKRLQPTFSVKMSPRYASTQLVPSALTPSALRNHDIRILNPQVLLAHGIKITPLQLSTNTHTLETFDFESELAPSATTHSSTITITKPGTLNALIGYITADFGEDCRPARRGHLSSLYGQPKGPSFSSHGEDPMATTSWPNPIILLQHPIPAQSGDTITIRSVANVDTLTPSYTISIVHEDKTQNPAHTFTQNITLDFSSIYSSPTNDTTTPLPQQLQLWELPHPTPTTPDPTNSRNHPHVPATSNPNTIPELARAGAGARTTKRPRTTTPSAPTNTLEGHLRAAHLLPAPDPHDVRRLIAQLHTHLDTPPHSKPLFCPSIELRVRSHLHLHSSLNDHFTNTQVGAPWHSPHHSLSVLGADTRPREEFIQEHPSWIHLTESHTDTTPTGLSALIRAVAGSKHSQARLAGLFHIDGTADITLTQLATDLQVRFCKLATFPADTLEFTRPLATRVTLETEKGIIPTATHLLLIEMGDTPPIHWSPLEAHIRASGGTPSPPPWSYMSRNYTSSTVRTSPDTHPALAFLHPERNLIRPHLNKSKIETHSKMAGALGILPPIFVDQLRFHSYTADETGLTAEHTREISGIILRGATASYTRYLQWYKKDKYGAS